MPAPFVQDNADKRDRGYLPSFFPGGREARISAAHADCETAVAEVRGKLEPADHLKLFECGYHARGSILEIGRLHGKSTIVLALGVRDAGHGAPITSIDLEPRYEAAARKNLREHGVEDDAVTLLSGDSSEVVASLPGLFDIVFVDGDHGYDGVCRDILAVSRVLADGAVVAFHDYYHPANQTGDYGVQRAVDELAGAHGLAFRGRHGGIALFESVAREE